VLRLELSIVVNQADRLCLPLDQPNLLVCAQAFLGFSIKVFFDQLAIEPSRRSGSLSSLARALGNFAS